MKISRGPGFLKKRKLLVGSFAIVLLFICGIIAMQMSNKAGSEQNVAGNNLVEIGDSDNTINKTPDEMSSIENSQERESIQNSETEEDYYMMSTSLTAEEVEQFAVEIKNDILNHNWDALAEKISYPIVVSGITVNNQEDFLNLDIDGNLKQDFVDAISTETCKKMFCNQQGVMMGATGQIWLGNVDNGKGSAELLIIGINDMLET